MCYYIVTKPNQRFQSKFLKSSLNTWNTDLKSKQPYYHLKMTFKKSWIEFSSNIFTVVSAVVIIYTVLLWQLAKLRDAAVYWSQSQTKSRKSTKSCIIKTQRILHPLHFAWSKYSHFFPQKPKKMSQLSPQTPTQTSR